MGASLSVNYLRNNPTHLAGTSIPQASMAPCNRHPRRASLFQSGRWRLTQETRFPPRANVARTLPEFAPGASSFDKAPRRTSFPTSRETTHVPYGVD